MIRSYNFNAMYGYILCIQPKLYHSKFLVFKAYRVSVKSISISLPAGNIVDGTSETYSLKTTFSIRCLNLHLFVLNFEANCLNIVFYLLLFHGWHLNIRT